MAFTKLINLNCHVAEADNYLLEIRMKQLEEMGYHPNEAFTALLKSKNKTVSIKFRSHPLIQSASVSVTI